MTASLRCDRRSHSLGAPRLAIASLAGLLPVAVLATAAALAADPPATKPPASCAEPQPPQSLPEGTIVYRTLSGREAQVTFTSAAPLERIVGKSNGIVGFALAGPADEPARLAGATWVLPVATLATGLPLRDEHMISSAWLDAGAHPDIRFELTRVDAIRELKRGEDFTTWSGTLVGRMTLHGVSREMQVPDARFSFLKESARTRAIAPGNLLFLKCDYAIKLSDFGIRHADVPGKVSDSVSLSQMLRLSSATPDAIRKAAPAPSPPSATAP